MIMNDKLKIILTELRQALESLYGDRLSRLILFGSQARGDAMPDSDIDIMIVLKTDPEQQQEDRRVTEVTAPLNLKHEVVICCITVPEARFFSENTPFLRNVRREGHVL